MRSLVNSSKFAKLATVSASSIEVRRMKRTIALLIMGLSLLAACSTGPSGAERTLEAQRDSLGTQIADVRSTATLEADRLLVTAEFAQTLVAQMRNQNQVLSATIAALGGDAALVAPRASTPTLASLPVDPAAPQVTAEGIMPATGEAVLAATPTAAPPALYNAVTARGVGANDCALAAVSQFTAADQSIYVVATASNIQPGMTLASRWYYEGQEVIRHEFTPEFAISQNCIWFFIDPEETPFNPGSWTVQLEVNGQPDGDPVAFSIGG
jgi:hypothetical protein